ncbi:MAG: ADP-ribosylglycohydrolase family protein [Clostridia bacterium]|nr:ADP-ribosylglycohydrolase family protein [Clostridia bacterium]
MQLTYKEYKDKVRACWLGKNIGGTLGAPFECIRGVYEIDYSTHDLSLGVLPNDDLDLQLVWLNAAEKYGKNLTAEQLGEYWISYVVAEWSEYGAGQNNLRYGLLPPISGWYNNHNKDSCGCFIRSELWACLAPGHPEIAVKYAREDAICDHAHEGMYGEIFCAALQSAAFVENDREKLMAAALSYIPADCAIAKVAATAKECYESGMDWKEARKVMLQRFPGSFGLLSNTSPTGFPAPPKEDDIPAGPLGYDAPSNIGIMLIGWYYGEGDFSKSICIAAGCCEDGDCTAGTLGAVLGIMYGTSIIEDKWLQPIGDEIKSISIDMTKFCIALPHTVTELTRRVVNLMPTFMNGHINFDEDGVTVFEPVDSVLAKPRDVGVYDDEYFAVEVAATPVAVHKSNTLFDIRITYNDESLAIRAGETKKFHAKITNNLHSQQWLDCKFHLPEGWTARPGSSFCLNLNQKHGGCMITEFDFTVTPDNLTQGRYDLLLEIKSNGRLQKMFVELPLLTSM